MVMTMHAPDIFFGSVMLISTSIVHQLKPLYKESLCLIGLILMATTNRCGTQHSPRALCPSSDHDEHITPQCLMQQREMESLAATYWGARLPKPMTINNETGGQRQHM